MAAPLTQKKRGLSSPNVDLALPETSFLRRQRRLPLTESNPMSPIVRTTHWHEEPLWNVSLLPASKLAPAGQAGPAPAPQSNALRAPAVLSSRDGAERSVTAQAA